MVLALVLMTSSSNPPTAAAAAASDASPTSSAPPVLDRVSSSTPSKAGDKQQQQLDPATIGAYESLNKWKGCSRTDAPTRLVYRHNRSRAATTGFPTRLATGTNIGLTEHETAAVFGWTTGDYRLLNPIARGLPIVEFDDYPFLPQEMTKTTCRLSRADVMPYVRVLSSALSKLPPLSSQQMLWRGHRRRLVPSGVGRIFKMQGFTSVTRDRENAIEFATKSNEGRSNQRTVIGILGHSGGKCISKLSARPGEMEVLFPPSTVFEVVDPPGDTGGDDLRAVQKAAERMRESMPGAEIDLIYVREVEGLKAGSRKEEGNRQPMHVIRKDLAAAATGEWE